MTETDMNALADELDRLKHLEQTGGPGQSYYDYAEAFIENHDTITAALRSTPASVDVTGMSEAQIEDIRSHIRGSTEEKATYDYELGSGWRCFHCGEMFRTPGGAALHFGKPTDKPACTPASGPTREAWHLGSMNDGLFIINKPPRPSTDDAFHDRTDGPTMVLNVNGLSREAADALVMAHNATLSASGQPSGPVAWALSRWNAEVKNRPLKNIHRRSLDDTWRQVIRHFGGNPDELIGPPHDALLDASPSPTTTVGVEALAQRIVDEDWSGMSPKELARAILSLIGSGAKAETPKRFIAETEEEAAEAAELEGTGGKSYYLPSNARPKTAEREVWQPIETAPRDGLPILIRTHKGAVQVGKYNKHLHIWIEHDGRECWRDVTWWMPIPDGPTAINGGDR